MDKKKLAKKIIAGVIVLLFVAGMLVSTIYPLLVA